MTELTDKIPITQPFIPCANLATAQYYRSMIDSGESIGAEICTTNTQRTLYQGAPWFVVIVN